MWGDNGQDDTDWWGRLGLRQGANAPEGSFLTEKYPLGSAPGFHFLVHNTGQNFDGNISPLWFLKFTFRFHFHTCLKIGRRTILTEEISAFISDLLHLQISFPQRGRQKRNHGVETGQELAPIFVQFFGGSSYIYHPSRWSQCEDKAAALWRHSKREQIVTHCLELSQRNSMRI